MTPAECAEYLRQYNAWRRGDDSFPQPVPKALGQIIERTIEILETPTGINGVVPWVAIHIKTGNEYLVIGEAVNCTNSVKDCLTVIYQRDGRVFVRKASEFLKKFKAKERS